MRQSLVSGFLATCDRVPDNPALEVENRVLSYAQLLSAATAIAEALIREAPTSEPHLTAVFGHRSVAAFSGVLGALLRGHGYVPLNPSFPPDRTSLMLNRSGCDAVVVDDSALPHLQTVLSSAERSLLIVVPDPDMHIDDALLQGRHRVIRPDVHIRHAAPIVPDTDPNSIAYLLFTSGSTGQPKGVMVAHRNVRAFLDFMTNRYEIDSSDKLSQTFDLTFDLSVFDMFVAWERGATVCCPSQQELRRPDRYIARLGLTLWFAVPSVAIYMSRLGMLKPDVFPSLRISLFCGEPLPLDVANAWVKAAPQSILENLYGPTELTVACTLYRHDVHQSSSHAERGLVPIGWPYPGMEARIVDENLHPLDTGSPGELLMTGPQMTLGYWKDEERTRSAFIVPPGEDRTFYRTGDRVRERYAGGPLLYLGRLDHQIKVRGYRVELGEIEAALRDASGLGGVVAIGWPVGPTGPSGIEAFVEGALPNTDAVIETLKARLPAYMVPARIHSMDTLPLNANQKYDRIALLAALEGGL